jgi:hypothetical protein
VSDVTGCLKTQVSDVTGCQKTQVSDVTGCQKIQVSDVTGFTVLNVDMRTQKGKLTTNSQYSQKSLFSPTSHC